MNKNTILATAIATAIIATPVTTISEASAQPSVSQNLTIADSIAESEMVLFKNIYSHSQGKNTVISPYSIGTIMNMALIGADGKTEKEMRQVLKISSSKSREDVMKESKELNDSIISSGQLTIECANSIWSKNSINRKYSEECRKYFNAESKRLKSAEAVNNWCSKKTHGKIKRIINSVSGIDVALINAVYFNGTWQTAFKKSETKQESFKKSDGKTMPVSMMKQKLRTPYYEDKNFKMVALPYKGGNTSMVFILPTEGTNMKTFLSNMTHKKIVDSLNDANHLEVNVHVPKFKTEYEAELSKEFQNMGMKSAFSFGADFSKISYGLRITKVLHKTYIDVNEQGTEAAAVTGVMMTKSMALPTKPKEFKADRPFMFVIMDTETNMPLFEGVIEKPEYK